MQNKKLNENKNKRVNFNVDPQKWERFKKVSKLKNSDANKELRKFIDKFLSENSQLALEV